LGGSSPPPLTKGIPMKKLTCRRIQPERTRTRAARARHPSLACLALLMTHGCSLSSIDASNEGSFGPVVSVPIAPPREPDSEGPAAPRDRESMGSNPFVIAAHDPLSTFATDADTASYDLFVRELTLGSLPDPASVRLEDYVNYFDYDYPAAAADAVVPFSVHLAAAPNPWRAGTALFRVGISGKQPPPAEKKPANVVFLVDVSGSMAGADRLPLAQQLLRQTLDLLAPDDRVSIVTYAADTRVRLAPTSASDRDRIIREIDGLSSGGSTAGASGIDLAYDQASRGFIQGGLNHVILCTDGDFNVGPSSTEALLELIRDKRQTGVTLTALGFGSGNLNDSMLEAVSNAGNGFYGVITSESQAAEYVRERLLSTLTLIAKDVKVQVEFNSEEVAAYRLLGYENRAIADQDFRVDAVDAGEIGAGHQVTALYELVLSGGSVPNVPGAPEVANGEAFSGQREVAQGELARVKLRYKQPDAGQTDAALEVLATLAPAQVAGDFASADADLRFASAVAAFAEILKKSPYATLEGLDLLELIFREAAARDDSRAELLELFDAARSLL
jgi:Ca-activated chloride channel homolog